MRLMRRETEHNDRSGRQEQVPAWELGKHCLLSGVIFGLRTESRGKFNLAFGGWLRPSLVLIDCPHSTLRNYILVELSGMSGKRGDMGAGELVAAGS